MFRPVSRAVSMKRRDFIARVGGSAFASVAAASWPLAARAQQAGRVPRVVFWLGGTGAGDPEGQRHSAAFHDALIKLGWTPGRNLQVESRWIGGLTYTTAIEAAATEVNS